MKNLLRQPWLSRLPYHGALFLCLATPFVFLPTISEVSEFPKRALLQTGSLLLLGLWLLVLAQKEKPRIQFPTLLLPFLALLLWGAASLSYAVNQFEGIKHLLHYGACALFFFLFIHAVTREDLPAVLDSLIVAGLGIVLLGIAQHLLLFKGVPQAVPPAATFVNKNIAADFVLITLPLATIQFLRQRDAKASWAYALTSGLMIVFLLYTRTRAAWVAMAAEAAMLLLWAARANEKKTLRERWSRSKRAALLTTLAIVLVMANLDAKGLRWQFDEIGQRAASIASTSHNIDRIAIWRNTLAMIKDHPVLGVGLGNHKVHYPLYTHAVMKDGLFSLESQLINVHNDFLQFLAELGTVGFPLLLWLCLLVDKNYFRLSSRHDSFETRILLLGAYAAIVGIAVSSCFGFPFQMAAPPFYLAVLMGCMHVLTSDTPQTFALPSRRVPLYLGIVVLTGAVALGGSHYRAIIADGHAIAARRFLAQKQWSQTLYEGLQAIYLAPGNKKILSEVGAAYIELGAYEEAIRTLNDALQGYPNLVNAQLNLAVAHTRKGEYDRAEQLYLRSLAILPERVDTYLRLGNLARLQQRPEYATAYYEKALALSKDARSRAVIEKLIDAVDRALPAR
ncbi:MAG: O-antigen ligase family protein [Thermodesulfobacteriota bacterium]